MANQLLIKRPSDMSVFFEKMEDFLKPWNEWLPNPSFTATIPSVNITDSADKYEISFAVPGTKKEEIMIDVAGNILTVSAEKEEDKEDQGMKYSRKEYNYSSFSRSFTLPDDANKEKIEASYTDGVLKLVLPKKEEIKKLTAKQIAVQ